MNQGKDSVLEESAHSILRINAGIDDVVRSMKLRSKQVRREFGPEEEKDVRDVFRKLKPRGLSRPTIPTEE